MKRFAIGAALVLGLALVTPASAIYIDPTDDDNDIVLSMGGQDSFTKAIEDALYDYVVAENEDYCGDGWGTRITRMNSASRWHAKDFGDRNYFSHSIPQTTVNGVTVDDWPDLELAFEYSAVGLQGQNIAASTGLSGWTAAQYADFIFNDGWMQSSGHRANIRGCDWTVMGMGVWRDDSVANKVYSVNIFGDASKEEVNGGGSNGATVRACSDTSCTFRFNADLGRKTFVIDGPESGDGHTWDYVKVKGEDPAYGWIRDDQTTGDQEP